MIYAAFRAWKTLRRYFISLPSKTAFYCVTKSREPTTNESDVFSVLACTLFVSVDDKLVSILPYHRKAKALRLFSSFYCITIAFFISLLCNRLRCAGCSYSLLRSGWQAYTEAPRSAYWQLQDWCWDTDDHRFPGLSVFFHVPGAL